MKDKNIQKNSYFEYRQVKSSFYKQAKLPLWIKNELTSTDRILDYGCGFGQIIKALMDEGYTEVYGVDIEKNAINFCVQQGFYVKGLNIEGKLDNPFKYKFNKIIISHVIEHMPKDKIIDTLMQIKDKFLVEGW